MSAAPLTRRPLVCGLFQTAQTTTRQIARRCVSSAATPSESRFRVIPTQNGGIRTAFALYDPPAKKPISPEIAKLLPPPQPSQSPDKVARVDVMRAYHQQQIAVRDPTGARTLLFSRKNPDAVRPGDVLQVTSSAASAEAFAGVCLAIRRSGIETAVLLRGQLAKTGVEMWFKVYSKSVGRIDRVQRAPKRARRAKLHYMRQPKHDRGSVDDVVRQWRRSRNVMRTRGGAAAAAAKATATANKKK